MNRSLLSTCKSIWLFAFVTIVFASTAFARETIIGLDLADQSAKSAKLVTYDSDSTAIGKHLITEQELKGLEVLGRSGRRLVLVYLAKLDAYVWLNANKLKLSDQVIPDCQKSLPSKSDTRVVHGIYGFGDLHCKPNKK